MPGDAGLAHPNWHIRVISTPGPDTDLSVLVFFDNARFLIGAGEGTQRAFIQKKLGLKGLSAVFLPNSEQRTRGGLAGILMTAADAGMNKVDVIGPPDTAHHLATLRSCVNRDRFSVNAVSFPSNGSSSSVREVYKSPFITVSATSLSNSSAPSSSTDPSSEVDLPPNGPLQFDPCEKDFRPSTLSPALLRQWRQMIVQEMFGRSLRPPFPPPPTLAALSDTLKRESPPHSWPPFVHPATGKFTPNLPLSEYPLPLPAPSEMTDMVYIFQAPNVRGKFDVKRANELKIPSGPIRGRLTKGESVEIDDPTAPGGKRIVTPQDCLVGGGPGAALIVVSCTPENLQSLLDSTAFERYFSSVYGEDDTKLRAHAVIHRTVGAVYNDERYRAWMAKFGPETQHLIADPEEYLNDTIFTSSAWNVLHLSLLDWNMFPYPWSTSPSQGFEQKPPLPPNVQFARPNQAMKMHPPAPLEVIPRHDRDKAFPTTTQEAGAARKELLGQMKEYISACKAARTAIQKDPMWRTANKPTFAGRDIGITTLGTGSAMPSKYRNVSSTLLEIPGTGGVLLDCGEGTLGQLRRRFGPEGLRKVYEELKMIFISHLHADHHLGLQAILEDRFKHGITSKLYLLAPNQIALSLQESAGWQKSASDEALNNITFLDCYFSARKAWFASDDNVTSDLTPPSSPGPPADARRLQGVPREWIEEDIFSGARRWPGEDVLSPVKESYHARAQKAYDMVRDLGLWRFQSPVVDHRGRAYGLVLEGKRPDSWSIVYSGDTKPCDRLVEAGKDATLLIHEATLEDDKPETAAIKGHSTFGQAIDVGKRMNAKHILLNHFSQRYPKVPIWSIEQEGGSSESQPVVSISFDLMTAKISDLWKMKYYVEPINVLFAEDEIEEGDDTTAAVEHDVNAGAEEDGDVEMEEAAANGVATAGNAKPHHKPGNKANRPKHSQPARGAKAGGKKRSSTPPVGAHGKKAKEETAGGDVEKPSPPKLAVPRSEDVKMGNGDSVE